MMEKLLARIRNMVHVICDMAFLLTFRMIAAITPRNPKKIIFGAWWGRQFGDNAKYFMKYLLDRHEGFQCYWVGEEYLRDKVAEYPEVKFIRRGSKMMAWHLLTAKWAFFCLGMKSDISPFPTFGKVHLLSMWHGTRLKGDARKNWRDNIPDGRGILGRIKRWHYDMSAKARDAHCDASFSSAMMVRHQQFEAPWSFTEERSINAGTAKIDFLIQNAHNSELIANLREKYAKLLDLPLDKKWYLYMPTWRKGRSVTYSFSTTKMRGRFNDLLERHGAILVEKQHPQVIHEMDIRESHEGSIHVVANATMPDIDGQELLLCAERMISDYSGCLFEFECMGRPVIHFAYDYDYYSNDDRGFEFDLAEIAAGPIAKTEAELLTVLEMSDEQLLSQKGPKWREPIDGENGTACETFARHVGLVK